MGDKLNKGLQEFTRSATAVESTEDCRDPRSLLIVTILYLIALLSMPLENLTELLWFGIYPIIGSAVLGKSFNGIFLRSMIILPLVLLIGMFNPIIDKTPGVQFGNVTLTHGWITFLSITLRGMFALQSLLLLTRCCGFIGMCRAMRRLLVPAFLTTQMEIVYRYAGTIMEEAQAMRRARQARGYGRKNFGLKIWGVMIGQLFLRSIDRAQRVNQAMLSRGYNGTMPNYKTDEKHWKTADTVFLVIWIVAFVILRFYNPTLLFIHLECV